MFDELLEAVIPGGAWLAAGIALGTVFSSRLRPMAKAALKAGMDVAERAQELGAEAAERAQDLVAEAQHERRQAGQEVSGAPARARRTPTVTPEG